MDYSNLAFLLGLSDFIFPWTITYLLKAALTNIIISTMDQMTLCNEKGVTPCDKATDNYHPVPLRSAEHFSIFQFIVFVLGPEVFWVHHSSSFPAAAGSSFQPKY